MFPVMKNNQAVMYKNNVQSNVIIIFIIIFSYQQFVLSLLTPLAFQERKAARNVLN
jgi:heme/copper-type cytochrome/quinol oxidase subunit 4